MKFEKSCGAVIYRENGEFLIICHKSDGHWCFPKGHVEAGETEEETAIRETLEETGLKIKLVENFKTKIYYSPKKNTDKEVVFFLAKTEESKIIIQEEEVEDYKWVSFEKAMKKITYESSKEVLKEVKAYLESEKEYKEFFELIRRTRRNEKIMDAIIVDGAVGVGKTSLMNILIEEFGYEPFLEPVTDNPLLDKFYYNRKRYAFPLQIFFLNRRFAMLKAATEIKGAVMDRSIYGDVIFARLLKQGGDMEPEEYDLYKELLANMLEHVQAPKLMIYLETSVEDMMNKIKRRGRDYEQVVELEYWQKLNKEYRDYFACYNISPILKINVEKLDFVGNTEHRDYVINLVRAKLREIM